MSAELPFSFKRARDGLWYASWQAQKLFVVVGGDEEGPDAACAATLHDMILRWPEIRETIATYVTQLPPDTPIVLEKSDWGAFAARDCGFGEQRYEGIDVRDPTAPRRAEITFYTGFPDGYANYRVVLDDGVPIAITAFAS